MEINGEVPFMAGYKSKLEKNDYFSSVWSGLLNQLAIHALNQHYNGTRITEQVAMQSDGLG